MPLARTHSIALVGVQGHPVEIEADIENGLVALLLVGLPDAALREARDRIRAAIVNSREAWPQRRITVGLSPASLPKRGSSFDVGIAVAILGAADVLPAASLADLLFIGELGLDGRLRPVRGVLPAVVAAAAAGFGTVVVPADSAPEAALVPGVRVLAADSLGSLLGWLRGGCPADGAAGAAVWQGGSLPPDGGGPGPAGAAEVPGRDLAELVGQPTARRAAEICAAGGHHLLLLGPPGVGKTMLAERLPTILPRLEPAAALEVTAIHSVAGTLPPGGPLLSRPPFCAPHHTATKAAIVGGGSGIIQPGAASLAHHGCLFLDEAPEFARDVLDALRQPLESGEVVVARLGVTARFPARFTLLLAANPCPCARSAAAVSSAAARSGCTCPPAARRRYLARLSGPLLDRVDVKVEFLPVGRAELLSDRQFTEPSSVVAKRVELARQRTAFRLRGTRWRLNAEIPGSELRRSYAPAPGALAPLERAMDLGEISARGVDRVIRLSWTVADLANVARPTITEVSYALGLWLGAAA
ncbi:MAG TPA: YifB family Mg chelatase-like AAA ATPase [Streptosporangiaceae bacterium]|nr:YifB family Mg chelatase-like AAA ATPase [Streptosporangiaceae bacterium]